MVLKKVGVAWFEDQITKVAIGINRCMEWWSSEGEHEE